MTLPLRGAGTFVRGTVQIRRFQGSDSDYILDFQATNFQIREPAVLESVTEPNLHSQEPDWGCPEPHWGSDEIPETTLWCTHIQVCPENTLPGMRPT